MKRLSTLVMSLAAALALTLGACAGSEKKVDKPKDDVEEVEKDDTEEVTKDQTDETDEKTDETQDENEDEQDEEEPTE